jgi:hypothetical protein
MRFILTILFSVFVICSDAQIIRANAYYTPLSQPLLLDVNTGAAAAYSLRKLRTAYTGAAIRVRRSSDNTEQDIGFVGVDLDTVSLKNFVGAGNGFMTRWYDQSGNARNATQTTAANQPRVVALGNLTYLNGKPTVGFIQSNTSNLVVPVINTSPGNLSAFFALNNVQTSGAGYLFDAQTSRTVLAIRDGEIAPFDNYAFYDGGAAFKLSSTTTTTGNQLLSYILGGSGSIFRNGVSILSTTYTQRALGGTIRIGTAFNAGGNTWDGNLSEVVLYNSDQSSNRTAIESNINTYYAIY